MHLILSGEGNTDIGRISFKTNEFEPAPMYFIIDKILEKKLYYSIYETTPESITFIPKSELIKKCKSFKTLAGKKKGKETGLFFKNAMGLAKIAKEKIEEKGLDEKSVVTILFRDSDGTSSSESGLWEKKLESIENGYAFEKLQNGIAMVPKPKSEAWLLCPLRKKPYQNCEDLENRSGNDDSPNNLKAELEEILSSKDLNYYNLNELIKDEKIDLEEIKMDSFIDFKEKLEKVV